MKVITIILRILLLISWRLVSIILTPNDSRIIFRSSDLTSWSMRISNYGLSKLTLTLALNCHVLFYLKSFLTWFKTYFSTFLLTQDDFRCSIPSSNQVLTQDSSLYGEHVVAKQIRAGFWWESWLRLNMW